MALRQITKELFLEKFQEPIAIVEADYQSIYFRYFISKQLALGIAITYRYESIDPIREYYDIDISKEIQQNLRYATVYIKDKKQGSKVFNYNIIKLFNDDLEKEFVKQVIKKNIIKKESEAEEDA